MSSGGRGAEVGSPGAAEHARVAGLLHERDVVEPVGESSPEVQPPWAARLTRSSGSSSQSVASRAVRRSAESAPPARGAGSFLAHRRTGFTSGRCSCTPRLAYVVAVAAAITLTTWRWERRGGERELVHEVAMRRSGHGWNCDVGGA